jgi:hypothetical protein
LLLALALFVSKWMLVAVFTVFLCVAIIEYIHLVQKFPKPKSSFQRTVRGQLLPIIWIIIPVLLVEYWCIFLNATNIMVALLIILCMNDTMAYVFG